MQVNLIPIFEDNYCYLVHGSKKENCLLVDPADEDIIYDWLQKNPELMVSHVLLTHKHGDHAGGAPGLVERLEEDYKAAGKPTTIEIVIGAGENQSFGTKKVKGVGTFEVNEIKVKHISVPCHTGGHQIYYLEDLNNKEKKNDPSEPKTVYRCVFTGDTLFIGGAGKFFEGTAEQMQKNFDEIRKLPEDTFVFCGHDYALANFQWASAIFPENEALMSRYRWAEEMNKKGICTIPSTVKDEIETNIFMMTGDPALQKKFGVEDEASLMKELREWKDQKKTFESKNE